MEASQSTPGAQPGETQVSTETPTEGSNLTTPQADQPIPNEGDRTGEGQETQPTDGSTAEANAADAAPPQDAGVSFDDPYRKSGSLTERDQAAEEATKQAELDAARQLHNERTGGGEVQPGELQQAQQEHNDRVGGGQVVPPSSEDEPQGD
jgi:hypothetical protein